MKRWIHDNALSLFFGTIFLLALLGQAISGLALYNNQQLLSGGEPVSFWAYVSSSSFAVDVAENWQSEYLQFFLMITITVWLVQRGSTESKEFDEVGLESDEEQKVGRHAEDDSPRWAKLGGWRTALYSRSLATVMGLFFLGSLLAQSVAGWAALRRAIAGLRRPAVLGRLSDLGGLLEPDAAELAVGVSGGLLRGAVLHLPAPARLPGVQAGRRVTRGHRPGRISRETASRIRGRPGTTTPASRPGEWITIALSAAEVG